MEAKKAFQDEFNAQLLVLIKQWGEIRAGMTAVANNPASQVAQEGYKHNALWRGLSSHLRAEAAASGTSWTFSL